MSAQRSANSVAEVVRLRSEFSRVRRRRAVITVSFLCVGLLIAGCQSAPLRSTSHRPTFSPRVSETISRRGLAPVSDARFEREPDASAFRLIPPENLPGPSANRASFQLVSWQDELPPPLLNTDSSLNSERPLWEAPAEEDCDRLSFGNDFHNAWPTLWRDTQSLVTWNNALILTAAGGLAIGFRKSDIDQHVRDEVAEHPQRWGNGTRILGNVGDIAYQAPVMLGVYGYSVWKQDEGLHDTMGAMLSASVITGVSTSALKLITNTERPSEKWNNGQYGFPSYHTASTFAIAAVLDEYYGCQVGLPAYALATAVGFSRLDDQDHDLSDVVFGAALGFVIGKTVAAQHRCDDSNVEICPYFHPTDGTPGVAWAVKF